MYFILFKFYSFYKKFHLLKSLQLLKIRNAQIKFTRTKILYYLLLCLYALLHITIIDKVNSNKNIPVIAKIPVAL